MKRLFAVLALAVCLPVAAQDVTATLQVKGDVRVSSSGTDFVAAVDNQPVVVGQRILVGENAIAKVRYRSECVRTYGDPGVYTIQPADCHRDKDRKEQAQNEESATGSGSSMAGTLGTILGTVVAAQQAIEHQDQRKPDRALSH